MVDKCTIAVYGFLASSCYLVLAISAEHPINTTSNSSCDEESCKFGVRYYKLLTYKSESSDLLKECLAACNESYTVADENLYCHDGCIYGKMAMIDRQQELVEYELSQALLIQEAYINQLMTQVMFQMLAGFPLTDSATDDGYNSVSSFVIVEENNDVMKISTFIDVRRDDISYSKQRVPVANHLSVESQKMNVYADSRDEDFERDISRNDYTRHLLSMLLLISALVLVWLSCATGATAPKQKIVIKDYSIVKKPIDVDLYIDNKPAPVHNIPRDDDVMLLKA